ncbi:hypothetical protein CI109_102460 [Kwoniella shandongensis]|uniref:Uncharacterized protein n=1 Tax=Kwoniella shandongensis TaxID=1734106 RepID=A0A5M6BZY4_9TREE|nr:uncharacterized protein CI109_003221 [Kwoniella shandongensis]KAA5528323.1 hypothetical protein CI109_003221 [Kwoniella shandongensis]
MQPDHNASSTSNRRSSSSSSSSRRSSTSTFDDRELVSEIGKLRLAGAGGSREHTAVIPKGRSSSSSTSKRRGRRAKEVESNSQSQSVSESDSDEDELSHRLNPNPLRLHLLSHPERGRGVFTGSPIPAGTIIEEAPVLLFSREEYEEKKLDDTVLGSYVFNWSNGAMAIGLGMASFFNHSSRPNVTFIRNTPSSTIRFITCRRVEADEELCICYTPDETKLWFIPAADDTKSLAGLTLHGIESSSEEDSPLIPIVKIAVDDLIAENGHGEQSVKRQAREKRLELAKQKEKERESGLKDKLNTRIEAYHEAEKKRHDEEQQQEQDEREGRALALQLNGVGGEESEIRAPKPLRLASSTLSLRETSRSSTPTSSSSTPMYEVNYPPLPEGMITSLPAPLHSEGHKSKTNRKSREQPAELTADLDWTEEDWEGTRAKAKEDEGGWGEVLRVKGPAERENDGDDDDLMEVWALEFTDPKMTRVALNLSKEISPSDERLRHLKRVCRRNENGQETCRIALCPLSDHSIEELQALMTDFSPLLSELTPIPFNVPASGARTQEQLRRKHHIWPISFSPGPVVPSSSALWPVARKAWVSSGIRRVLDLALQAKRKGEIPVATYCTSQPSIFWPNTDGFIPPTTNLRADSYDTRLSESHPLRHATLNCVASIAHLRTVPPFTDVPPTRNGADYLLTSLTLFISHEPCVMCSMALLHSRVKEVFYVFPRKNGGGFENTKEGGGFGIHARRDLNHRFEVWKWDGEVDEQVRKELEIPDDLQL